MFGQYIKGYKNDAAIDIVLDFDVTLNPGLNQVELFHKYTPRPGEVAFVIARSSAANEGLIITPVAIDPDYNGTLTIWIFNASGRILQYLRGERFASIVSLQLARDTMYTKFRNLGQRGDNKVGSSN